MADAPCRLQIPTATVLTSPTYRAMETVTFARLERPTAVTELGDGVKACRARPDRRRGCAPASPKRHEPETPS